MIEQKKARTLLFVSDVAPVGSHASSVILFRHLTALEKEGFTIVVCMSEDKGSRAVIPSAWICVPLPVRRRFYPPYRPGIGWTRALRWILFDRVLNARLGGRRIDCVLSLLHGEFLANYASWISRQRGIPLFYFYHDRGELLSHSKEPRLASRLRSQNLRLLGEPNVKRVWSVSDELIYAVEGIESKFRTVYPLPEELGVQSPAVWRDAFRDNPTLAYAGSIYNEVMDPLRMIARRLAKLGGHLRLYSHMHVQAKALQSEFPGVVVYVGDIPVTREVCEDIQSNASAFVVAYPEDVLAMPWSLDCFPSKFTQLVHIGIPGLVFAPSQTSIARWCVREGWLLYGADFSAATVDGLLSQITRSETWIRAAGQSHAAATHCFDPNTIKAQVLGDIEAVLGEAREQDQ